MYESPNFHVLRFLGVFGGCKTDAFYDQVGAGVGLTILRKMRGIVLGPN